MTVAAALAWLKSHPRAAASLGALVLLLLGVAIGRASAPKPRIEYREKVVTQTQTATHEQATQTTQAQQSTASTSSEHRDESKSLHVHQVERIAKDGSKVITTDKRFEDETHVEEAQQVSVTFKFGSLAFDSLSAASNSTQSTEKSLTQTPASAPRWALGALGGISTNGSKAFAVEGGLRLAGPVWLQGEVLAGGGAGVAGLIGARVEF